MTRSRFDSFKHLEGRRVSVALADGARIDDCSLLGVLQGVDGRLWVHTNGADVLLPADRVRDVWETSGGSYPRR